MKMQEKNDNAGEELLGDAGIGMKALDRILELLQDAQPHSLDEIKAQIPVPAEKLALVLDFLAEFKFITLLDTEARITPLGLSFLELPAEIPSD
jgi:predicted transcriptional regulator